jgi:[protein-PII] uridylyltransferase
VEDLPDVAYLASSWNASTPAPSGILDSVRRREARARNRPGTSKSNVELVHDASESAAVVDVRTGDRDRAALRARPRAQ